MHPRETPSTGECPMPAGSGRVLRPTLFSTLTSSEVQKAAGKPPSWHWPASQLPAIPLCPDTTVFLLTPLAANTKGPLHRSCDSASPAPGGCIGLDQLSAAQELPPKTWPAPHPDDAMLDQRHAAPSASAGGHSARPPSLAHFLDAVLDHAGPEQGPGPPSLAHMLVSETSGPATPPSLQPQPPSASPPSKATEPCAELAPSSPSATSAPLAAAKPAAAPACRRAQRASSRSLLTRLWLAFLAGAKSRLTHPTPPDPGRALPPPQLVLLPCMAVPREAGMGQGAAALPGGMQARGAASCQCTTPVPSCSMTQATRRAEALSSSE
ncbi:hypothetical protein V8C86DRAFT_2438651 [Haematococcus lacustris]